MKGNLLFHTDDQGISEWCFKPDNGGEILVIEDNDHLIIHDNYNRSTRYDAIIKFASVYLDISIDYTATTQMRESHTVRVSRVPVGRPSGWDDNKRVSDAEAWAYYFDICRSAKLEDRNGVEGS